MNCGQCLYFDENDDDYLLSGGRCQLNPPVFIEGEWRQPKVMDTVTYKVKGVENVRVGDWCGQCKEV